jgi:hypothetical protein
MIADSRLPVDILMDHHLKERIQKYPLLILPEWEHVAPDIRNELVEYVKNGGNLIVIGAKSVRDFSKELSVELSEPLIKDDIIFVGLKGEIVKMKTNSQPFKSYKNAVTLGIRLTADDWRFTTEDHIATVTQYGKGKIAGIFVDIGNNYNRHQNSLFRHLIGKVVSSMVPSFLSEIKSCDGNLHQVVSRKNNSIYIHLINANGPHNNPNVLIYDDVTPLRNIKLELSLDKKPTGIKLQPANTAIPFTYKNGKAILTVQEVPIYSIVEVTQD